MIPATAARASRPREEPRACLSPARSVTSRVWVRAVPPPSLIRVAVSCRPSASRSAQCTVAPASASRRAEARPMPLAAPVTNAVRPLRSYAVTGIQGPCEHFRAGRQSVRLRRVGAGVGPDWQLGHQYVGRSRGRRPGRRRGSGCGSAGTGAGRAVDEEVLPAGAARRGPDRPVPVGLQQPLGQREQASGPVGGQVADREPGGDPAGSTARPCRRCRCRRGCAGRAGPRRVAGGVGEHVGEGPVRVPVGAEQVGAEVADGAVLVARAQEFQHGQPVADGRAVRGRRGSRGSGGRGRRASAGRFRTPSRRRPSAGGSGGSDRP